MKLVTLLFLIFTACILTHSPLSLSYASLGLELWFQKMIPTLLPFMILSGIMVRLGLTEKISMIVYPVLGPVYKVRKNVVYCMLLGFLCGFPMGAKVTADLRRNNMIDAGEGEYLLAFCNNIGPVYFCSFVLPLLGLSHPLPFLFGMYGIPLLYGLILRYTVFRDLSGCSDKKSAGKSVGMNQATQLKCCSVMAHSKKSGGRLLKAMDESVQSSLQSILTLGGYMILFNLFNLLPHILLGRKPTLLAPLLEITGGLNMLGGKLPLYSLLTLSFGGLSCIAQTYSCIRETDLSLNSYLCHKMILTLLSAAFYLCLFLAAPEVFPR